MELKLDSRFKKKLQGKIERYEFQVGILNDKKHKSPNASTGLGRYAGGPVRKASRKNSSVTISEVSEFNRKRMDVNYLTDPFQKKSSDIINFTNEFFKYAFGESQEKRLVNLLQAIVRNPILRGDYGSNSVMTRKRKGFDRQLIDTAQFFKAIKAVVIKR